MNRFQKSLCEKATNICLSSNKMLKFLDNRTHEKEPKSPKKYQPEMLYGNSYECPKEFQTKHTLFHKPTYVNPYLKYEKQRIRLMPSSSMGQVEPTWKSKVDLQSVEEHKIIASKPEGKESKDFNGRYLKSFHKEFEGNSSRFKKIKGEFTSFIEKNDKFKGLGPLHGDFRDSSRIEETRRSVWHQPRFSEHSMSQRTVRAPKSQMGLSIRSSVSKNSSLISERQKIRQNRERAYKNYKRSLQQRKEDQSNTHGFELPRAGPGHELTFYDDRALNRTDMRRYGFGGRQSQSEEIFKDIETFERTMTNRFK